MSSVTDSTFNTRFAAFISAFTGKASDTDTVEKTTAVCRDFLETARSFAPTKKLEAIEFAFTSQFPDVASLLVSAIAEETLDCEGRVVLHLHKMAIRHQQPDCLVLILDQFRASQVVNEAVIFDCLESGIPQEMIVRMLQIVVPRGISQAFRIAAVKRAVELNNPYAVEILLQTGKIPDEMCLLFVYNAAAANDLPLLNALKTNGPISEYYLELRINEAIVDEEPHDVVIKLLNCGLIPEGFRGELLLHYVEREEFVMVRDVLQNGPVSLNDLKKAVVKAGANKEIADLLTPYYDREMTAFNESRDAAMESVAKRFKPSTD